MQILLLQAFNCIFNETEMSSLEELMEKVNSRYGWKIELKREQSDVLRLVLGKKNVIAVLPTGYGKSLLFLLPPLLMDEVSRP